MPLSPRERLLRTLRFEPVDRPPVVGGFARHPAFIAEAAGVTVAEFWKSPRRTAIAAFKALGADVMLALILPDPNSEACAQVVHKVQTTFHSPEDVRDYALALPPPEAVRAGFDADACRAEYLKDALEVQAMCGDVPWIPNGVHRNCPIFDWVSEFGYENYLMALTLYPEAMERVFAHDGERAFLMNQVVAAATRDAGLVPVVWTGSDACDNRGPYVKPELMERIYFPHLRRALSPLREAGLTLLWHSDGYIPPLVPALLAAGIDGFQGLQEKIETCIDVAALDRLRTAAGRRPVFVGSISSTVTMPFGTPDDVRGEVRRWQRFAQERGGGVLLNFSSSLGPEVPKANIYAFYEAAQQA